MTTLALQRNTQLGYNPNGLRNAQLEIAQKNPFLSTLAGTLQGTVAGGSLRTAGNIASSLGAEQAGLRMSNIARSLQEDAGSMMAPQLDYESVDGLRSGWDFVKANMAQGLGSMIPMMIGRGIGGHPLGIAAGFAPQMGENLGRLDNDPVTTGMSEREKLAYGLPTAVAQTGLDYIVPSGQIGNVIGKMGGKAGAKALGTLGASLVSESATETGQEVLGQGMHSLANPLRDKSGDTKDLIQAGLGGFFGAGPVAGVQAGAGYVRDKLDERTAAGEPSLFNKLAAADGEARAKASFEKAKKEGKAHEWIEANLPEDMRAKASLQVMREENPFSQFAAEVTPSRDLATADEATITAFMEERESKSQDFAAAINDDVSQQYLRGEIPVEEFIEHTGVLAKRQELKDALPERKASLYTGIDSDLNEDFRIAEMDREREATRLRGEGKPVVEAPTNNENFAPLREMRSALGNFAEIFETRIRELNFPVLGIIDGDPELRRDISAVFANWIQSQSDVVPTKLVEAVGPREFQSLFDLSIDTYLRLAAVPDQKKFDAWIGSVETKIKEVEQTNQSTAKMLKERIDPRVLPYVTEQEFNKLAVKMREDVLNLGGSKAPAQAEVIRKIEMGDRTKVHPRRHIPTLTAEERALGYEMREAKGGFEVVKPIAKQREATGRDLSKEPFVTDGDKLIHDSDLVRKYKPYFGPNTEMILQDVYDRARRATVYQSPAGRKEGSELNADDMDGVDFAEGSMREDDAQYGDGLTTVDAASETVFTAHDKRGRSFDRSDETARARTEDRKKELATQDEMIDEVSPLDREYARSQALAKHAAKIKEEYKDLFTGETLAGIVNEDMAKLSEAEIEALTDSEIDLQIKNHLQRMDPHNSDNLYKRIQEGDGQLRKSVERAIGERFFMLRTQPRSKERELDLTQADIDAMKDTETIGKDTRWVGGINEGRFYVQPEGFKNPLVFSSINVIARMRIKKPGEQDLRNLFSEGYASILLNYAKGDKRPEVFFKRSQDETVDASNFEGVYLGFPPDFVLQKKRGGGGVVTIKDAMRATGAKVEKARRSEDDGIPVALKPFLDGTTKKPMVFPTADDGKAFAGQNNFTNFEVKLDEAEGGFVIFMKPGHTERVGDRHIPIGKKVSEHDSKEDAEGAQEDYPAPTHIVERDGKFLLMEDGKLRVRSGESKERARETSVEPLRNPVNQERIEFGADQRKEAEEFAEATGGELVQTGDTFYVMTEPSLSVYSRKIEQDLKEMVATIKTKNKERAERLHEWIAEHTKVVHLKDGRFLLVPPRGKQPKSEAPAEHFADKIEPEALIFVPQYESVKGEDGKRLTWFPDKDGELAFGDKHIHNWLSQKGYTYRETKNRKAGEGPYEVVKMKPVPDSQKPIIRPVPGATKADPAKRQFLNKAGVVMEVEVPAAGMFIRYDTLKLEDKKHLVGIITETEEMAAQAEKKANDKPRVYNEDTGEALHPRKKGLGEGSVAMLTQKMRDKMKQGKGLIKGTAPYEALKREFELLKLQLMRAELTVELNTSWAMSGAEKKAVDASRKERGEKLTSEERRDLKDQIERLNVAIDLAEKTNAAKKNPPPQAPEMHRPKEEAKLKGMDLVIAPVSTEGYAGDLGRWARKEGVAFSPKRDTKLKGKVVLVSVPGATRNFTGMDTLIERVKQVLEAGATVRTDNEGNATRRHNAPGEGALRSALIEAGYSEKSGALFSEWRKGEATPTSSQTMQMNFVDGIVFGGTKHNMRPEFAGKSTMDLIKSGERTATSRNTQPTVKVGDVITFRNRTGDEVLVRVTKGPYRTSEVTAEQWSKLEGWEPALYENYKKAWQFQYELASKPAAKPEATPTAAQEKTIGMFDKPIVGDIWAQDGFKVVSTNLGGVHGRGLAKQAKDKGLINNINRDFDTSPKKGKVLLVAVKGREPDTARVPGQAFSEQTTGRNVELLSEEVDKLIAFARANPNEKIYMPYVGLGFGEGEVAQIRPILERAAAEPNIFIISKDEATVGRYAESFKPGVRRDGTTRTPTVTKQRQWVLNALDATPEALKARVSKMTKEQANKAFDELGAYSDQTDLDADGARKVSRLESALIEVIDRDEGDGSVSDGTALDQLKSQMGKLIAKDDSRLDKEVLDLSKQIQKEVGNTEIDPATLEDLKLLSNSRLHGSQKHREAFNRVPQKLLLDITGSVWGKPLRLRPAIGYGDGFHNEVKSFIAKQEKRLGVEVRDARTDELKNTGFSPEVSGQIAAMESEIHGIQQSMIGRPETGADAEAAIGAKQRKIAQLTAQKQKLLDTKVERRASLMVSSARTPSNTDRRVAQATEQSFTQQLQAALEKIGFTFTKTDINPDSIVGLMDIANKKLTGFTSDERRALRESAAALSHLMMAHEDFADIRMMINKDHFEAKAKRVAQLVSGGMKRGDALVQANRHVLEQLINKSFAERNKTPMQKIIEAVQRLLGKLAQVDRTELFAKVDTAIGAFLKDPARVKGADKQGFEQVSFAQAIKEDPHARSILETLLESRTVALTGSLALATQGTIYRQSGNLMHDLDFIVTEQSSVPEAEKTIRAKFPEAEQVYSFSINDSDGPYDVTTFLVPPEGMKVSDIVREGKKVVGYSVRKDGKVVGTFRSKDGIEHKKGERAIFVDLFAYGDGKSPAKLVEYSFPGTSGKSIKGLMGADVHTFSAKLRMGRPKDHWDYARYERYETEQRASEQTTEGTTPTPLTPEQQEGLIAEIRRLVGARVRILLNENIPEAGLWTRENGESTIQIGIHALDPYGTAYHESMHEFFKRILLEGDDNLREFLINLSQNKMLQRRVENLLAEKHPEAMKDALEHADEMLAYMFQFWSMNQLELGPKGETFFQKVAKFIREMLGILTDTEKGEQVFQAFFDGKGADTISPVGDVLRSLEGGNKLNKLFGEKRFKDLNGKMQRFMYTIDGRLVGNPIKALDTLGRLFSNVTGEQDKKLGFHLATEQKRNELQNKLKRAIIDAFPDRTVLTKEDEAMVEEALDGLSLGDGPNSKKPTVRKIQENVNELLQDAARYLDTKDVRIFDFESMVWKKVGNLGRNYFPRVWDNENIMSHHDEFRAELLQHHRDELQAIADIANGEVAAGKHGGDLTASARSLEMNPVRTDHTAEDIADAITQRMASTSIDPALGENDTEIGYTPAMRAINKRSLKWLDMNVFGKYLQKNHARTLNAYLAQAAKRGEYTERFGYDGRVLKDLMAEAHVKLLDEALEKQTGKKGAATAAWEKYRERVSKALDMRTATERTEHHSVFNDRDYTLWSEDRIKADIKLREARIEATYKRLEEGGFNDESHQSMEELIDLMSIENTYLGDILKAREDGKAEPERVDLRFGYMEELKKEFGEKFAAAQTEAAKETRGYATAIMAHEGTLGNDIAPWLRTSSSYMITYQNVRLLPLTLFSNFIDPLGVMVRGGDSKDAFNTFKRGFREVYRQWTGKGQSNDAETRMAELVGTIEASGFFSAMNGMYGSVYMNEKARRINDTLFRWNGVEALNRGIRVQATQVAMEFIKDLKRNPDQHTARYLKELRLSESDIRFNPDGSLDVTDQKMKDAIIQWVDEAVIRPNAGQRPAWASSPYFALFFHLKQFTYSFHRIILKRAALEAKHGNLTPWITLAAAYVPIAIAATTMRAIVQNFGEEPEWMKNQGLGSTVMHGIERAGLLGIGQFGYDIGSARSIPGGITDLLGPAVDQVGDLMTEDWTLGKHFRRALPVGTMVENAVK